MQINIYLICISFDKYYNLYGIFTHLKNHGSSWQFSHISTLNRNLKASYIFPPSSTTHSLLYVNISKMTKITPEENSEKEIILKVINYQDNLLCICFPLQN